MSFRQRLLYKISPTYRNTMRQMEVMESIRSQVSDIGRRYALLDGMEDSVLESLLKQVNVAKYGDEFEEKSKYDYISMQKNYYENSNTDPDTIVGQYEWHENFPYETFLLYKYGDIRFPIFDTLEGRRALDFGCGPGRMVKRMRLHFDRVDGCDISRRLLDIGKGINPESTFYLTNGDDLGGAPENFYDFIYCTISMQHIASHEIRTNILKSMERALRPGGKLTLQMAYNAEFPYVREHAYWLNNKKVVVKESDRQAQYTANDFHAAVTNGAYDVGIGEKDLPDVKAHFSQFFSGVDVWFANVSNYYKSLKGAHHADYWAKDWIFIHGEKHG